MYNFDIYFSLNRCIYNMDHNKTLAEIPEELKRKDLVVNILKDGQWGSFRHVPGKIKKNMIPGTHLCKFNL